MDPFFDKLYQAHQTCPQYPSPDEIASVFKDILGILFPDFCSETFQRPEEFTKYISTKQAHVTELIQNSQNLSSSDAHTLALAYFEKLQTVHGYLIEDVNAMYEGDPAAKSTEEVIRTYPGFYAIAAYRLAHEFHLLGITGLPRVITEFAHSKTGIDIHPAARIGRHFCIDHGTGVVIGETALIGNHVKIYQGVTLGALSIDKKDAISKRHPTLEDRVVVYAGATILGGQTVVGHDSIVGGNVWLTSSVPAYSKIYYQSRLFVDSTQETDMVVIKSATK